MHTPRRRSSLAVALVLAAAGGPALVAAEAAAAPRGTTPKATALARAAQVSWAKPRGAGVTATRIERRDLSAGAKRWTTARTVRGTRARVSGLKAGHRYRLRVRFRTTARTFGVPGRSVLVRVRGRTPAVVGGLVASGDGDAVALRWSAAKNATGYRIERVDVVSGGVDRLPGASAATSARDVPPARLQGRWLRYRVVATDGPAAAAPSDPVQARAAGLTSYAAYYALGDSYAAGTGLGQPYDDQECARSNRMWGALIPRSLVPAPVLIACSGAKTKDVRLSGAGGGTPQFADLGGTQLDRVRKAVAGTPGPTLITLSIGGNDALFVPEFTRCVTGDCTADRETETALIRGPVRRALDATFGQIREVAPGADVLVAGYPRLFDEGAVSQDPVFALTLSQDERRLANVWATQVDAEVHASAEAHGLHPVTDEVLKAYEGHGAGGPSPWINPVIVADPGTPAGTTPATPATASIHPNVAGNQAYADVMTAALKAYASQVRVR